MNYTELPVGFAMALAQNRAALEKFGAMTDSQKQQLIVRAHTARSRREMHQIVAELGNVTRALRLIIAFIGIQISR